MQNGHGRLNPRIVKREARKKLNCHAKIFTKLLCASAVDHFQINSNNILQARQLDKEINQKKKSHLWPHLPPQKKERERKKQQPNMWSH